MTINSVLIRGDGVAARCCGHLLNQAGYRVSFERTSRARVPLIMLSEGAQSLMRDVFQREDLFHDLPVIRKRIVAWGSEPVELDHSAVIISEEVLLDRLGMVSGGADARWTICAAPPLPASTVEHRFGSRMASAMKVEMKETEACWIEALEDGWLFLNSGWLIAVGAQPEELLGKSRVVGEQIVSRTEAAMRFPASPRIVTPLGRDGWICCGSAAMGFDPLCGDGTAHAVREAILASAVIRAADGGGDVEELLLHYEGRLTAGFQRHLAQCLEFYSSGGSGEWWKREAKSCIEGISWCRGRMTTDFRYRLEGLELKSV
jgi:2-polyprenyl-6-methoxyphenol hydroxylase-like FAD-dependent oxidoreductase